jgi:hypothetical protein
MSSQSHLAEAFDGLSQRLGIQCADLAAYLGAHTPNLQNALAGRRKLTVDQLIEMAALDAEAAEAELMMNPGGLPQPAVNDHPAPDREALGQKLSELTAELQSVTTALGKMKETVTSARRQLALLQAVRLRLADGEPLKAHWFDRMEEKCTQICHSVDPTQEILLGARIAALTAERDAIQQAIHDIQSAKP